MQLGSFVEVRSLPWLVEAVADADGLSTATLAEVRRARGFGLNPWRTGSRFIVSHHLLTDENYAASLRDVLGPFRARALLVLDEAHHAAPASGSADWLVGEFIPPKSGRRASMGRRTLGARSP